MGGLTGGLMHLFAHSHPWVGEARNRGMSLAQKFPGIKQWLTARAIG
jgi:2-polyprenyl-6-methoxyphenol hydroxylase-like FAD-dependent oxidoreductase